MKNPENEVTSTTYYPDGQVKEELRLAHVGDRLAEWGDPFVGALMFGWETLAYMLLGMAGLKSGFLTGAWERRRYVRTAGHGLVTEAFSLALHDVFLAAVPLTLLALVAALFLKEVPLGERDAPAQTSSSTPGSTAGSPSAADSTGSPTSV